MPRLRKHHEDYELYVHDGMVCLAGGSYEPSYCEELLPEVDEGEGEPHESRERAATNPMRFKNLRAKGSSVAMFLS